MPILRIKLVSLKIFRFGPWQIKVIFTRCAHFRTPIFHPIQKLKYPDAHERTMVLSNFRKFQFLAPIFGRLTPRWRLEVWNSQKVGQLGGHNCPTANSKSKLPNISAATPRSTLI